MNTITVYRVAHKDDVERGPWWGYASNIPKEVVALQVELNDSINLRTHPDPYSDNIRGCDFDLFAAPSIEKLKGWFGNGDIPGLLLDADYTVYEIIVNEDWCKIGRSGTQCAFPPDQIIDAKDIGILALVD